MATPRNSELGDDPDAEAERLDKISDDFGLDALVDHAGFQQEELDQPPQGGGASRSPQDGRNTLQEGAARLVQARAARELQGFAGVLEWLAQVVTSGIAVRGIPERDVDIKIGGRNTHVRRITRGSGKDVVGNDGAPHYVGVLPDKFVSDQQDDKLTAKNKAELMEQVANEKYNNRTYFEMKNGSVYHRSDLRRPYKGLWCKFFAHVVPEKSFITAHFAGGDMILFLQYARQHMKFLHQKTTTATTTTTTTTKKKKKKKKRPSNRNVTASGRNSDSSDRDGSGDGSSGGSSSSGGGGGTADGGGGDGNTGNGDTTGTGEGTNNNGGDQQSAAKRARHHRGVDELSNAVNSLTLADGNDGDDAGDRSVNGDDAGNDGVDGGDAGDHSVDGGSGDDVSGADMVANPTKERPVRPTTSTAALTRLLQLRGSQGRVADWKGASATCSKYATVRATERGFVATLRVTVDGVERTTQSGAQSTEGGAVEEAAAGFLGAGELEGWLGMAQASSVWAAGPVLSKL